MKSLTILSFLWKCYNLWWLPPVVCELGSLLVLVFMSSWNFMLSWVQKKFYNLGAKQNSHTCSGSNSKQLTNSDETKKRALYSWPLGNFHAFLSSANFFQNQLFWKLLSGIPSECQTDWVQIRPHIFWSGLNLFAKVMSRRHLVATSLEKRLPTAYVCTLC